MPLLNTLANQKPNENKTARIRARSSPDTPYKVQSDRF